MLKWHVCLLALLLVTAAQAQSLLVQVEEPASGEAKIYVIQLNHIDAGRLAELFGGQVLALRPSSLRSRGDRRNPYGFSSYPYGSARTGAGYGYAEDPRYYRGNGGAGGSGLAPDPAAGVYPGNGVNPPASRLRSSLNPNAPLANFVPEGILDIVAIP